MIDTEAAGRVSALLLEAAQEATTLRYIHSARHTEEQIRNCSMWEPRRLDLIETLCQQCAAIAARTGMPYADVELAITGIDTTAMQELTRRIGRDVLRRQGFTLPGQPENTQEE